MCRQWARNWPSPLRAHARLQVVAWATADPGGRRTIMRPPAVDARRRYSFPIFRLACASPTQANLQRGLRPHRGRFATVGDLLAPQGSGERNNNTNSPPNTKHVNPKNTLI